MAVVYEKEDRKVIPNWRDFKRTIPLGELENKQQATPINIDISMAISDWQIGQNIGVAADLVNSAFISGKTNIPEVKEAISFILNQKTGSSSSLTALANNINNIEEIYYNNSTSTTSKLELKANLFIDLQTYTNNDALYKLIHQYKNRVKRELKNPISWVELSRLYAFFGKEEQAERAMIIAVNLAPDNRYVLRSATRLFVHFSKLEKALYYLRKSAATKHDPWLASAHIATSSIMNRYSPLIKPSIGLITSSNFSNYEITELASTLGTLELSEGSFKKSKAYFDISLRSPNDNSLAQFEWVSKEDSRFVFNPLLYSNVANPFEAFALENFNRGNWQEAFDDCIKWFLDMPYSRSPILLGSYLTTSFIKDADATVLLCDAGLKANPNDPSILNNVVYALVNANRLEDAIPYIMALRKIKPDGLPNETKITLQATLGLIAISTGEIEDGKYLYELAIQNANSIKNQHLENLALVNYARALIVNGISGADELKTRVLEIKEDPKHRELQVLKEEVVRLYNIFKFQS